jgi:hypothetical protein
LAVLAEATIIARISLAPAIKGAKCFSGKIFDRTIISSRKMVSSASSSTMRSLLTKSALPVAREAARWLAAADVADRPS